MSEQAGHCPACAGLEAEVKRLTIERHRLVELLAAERERANAFFVSYPPQQGPRSDAALPPPPPSAHREAPPLRYQVADQLNAAVKRLPGVHRMARGMVSAIKLFRRR